MIEQDPEECIHGMYPPSHCIQCRDRKQELKGDFKFDLQEEAKIIPLFGKNANES